jgi:peroxiredoxin Q/BCP
MEEKKIALLAGELAPSFVLPGRFGRLVSLAEFRGKKNVLVYFYPKDDTPGCTKEACSLRDGWKELQARDVEILGISRDSLVSHDAFATKYNLPFELLSDPDQTVHGAYGAWGESKWGVGPIRKSFLIGKTGRILKVFEKVDTEHHAEEVLKAMESSVPPGASKPPAPEPKPAAPAPAPTVTEAVASTAQAVQTAVAEAAKDARKAVEKAAQAVVKKAETAGKAVRKAAKKVARKATPKKKAAKKSAPKKKAAKRTARKTAKRAVRKPVRKARKAAKRKKK